MATKPTARRVPYAEKLKDPRWQKKRLEVMERDGFACRDCLDDKSTLNVHHCHYSKGDPWDTDSKFLMTLCEDCHATRGVWEQSIKESIGEICALSKPNGVKFLSSIIDTVRDIKTSGGSAHISVSNGVKSV